MAHQKLTKEQRIAKEAREAARQSRLFVASFKSRQEYLAVCAQVEAERAAEYAAR